MPDGDDPCVEPQRDESQSRAIHLKPLTKVSQDAAKFDLPTYSPWIGSGHSHARAQSALGSDELRNASPAIAPSASVAVAKSS
jgi:hypothetical protein